MWIKDYGRSSCIFLNGLYFDGETVNTSATTTAYGQIELNFFRGTLTPNSILN